MPLWHCVCVAWLPGHLTVLVLFFVLFWGVVKTKTPACLRAKGSDGTLWESLLEDAVKGPGEGARAVSTYAFLWEKGQTVHSGQPGRVMATLRNTPWALWHCQWAKILTHWRQTQAPTQTCCPSHRLGFRGSCYDQNLRVHLPRADPPPRPVFFCLKHL